MKINSGFAGLIILLVIALAITASGIIFINKYDQENQIDLTDYDTPREFKIDDESRPNPTNPTNPTKSVQQTSTPKPNITAKPQSSRFKSNGIITIEDGATVQITTLTEVGTSLKIHIIFSNPTSADITVGPLRTSLKSERYGWISDTPPSPITLTPGQKREFDLAFSPTDDNPPYRFIYSNFNGTQFDLGTYE